VVLFTPLSQLVAKLFSISASLNQTPRSKTSTINCVCPKLNKRSSHSRLQSKTSQAKLHPQSLLRPNSICRLSCTKLYPKAILCKTLSKDYHAQESIRRLACAKLYAKTILGKTLSEDCVRLWTATELNLSAPLHRCSWALCWHGLTCWWKGVCQLTLKPKCNHSWMQCNCLRKFPIHWDCNIILISACNSLLQWALPIAHPQPGYTAVVTPPVGRP
jgi:hypothetical protein